MESGEIDREGETGYRERERNQMERKEEIRNMIKREKAGIKTVMG